MTLEEYQRRQAQIHKVDAWLERNARWGWLIAAFVLAASWLVKAVLDSIGRGGQ